MALYELTNTAITALDEISFVSRHIDERLDLQRLLKQNIDVIAGDTLIIAEEFCEWDESKRRIDLLGVDRKANLVVIELKRTEDGGHMELQAIRYAAMISTMTFSKAVEVYGRYLERNGSKDDAETALIQFFNWDEAKGNAFGEDVRIVLVSAEFSKEITTSVLWLNERELDIRCVRLRPYILENRVLLDVQQVIPLPEATSYTIKVKKKAEENRQTQTEIDFSKFDLTIDGVVHSHLTKRRLVFEVVRAALVRGFPQDQIAAMIPPNKWISVDGDLTAEEFQESASRLQAKLGGKYNLRRYFCNEGELFHIAGRTFALSNQWSVNTISIVDELVAEFPTGTIAYSKSGDS